MRLGNPKLRLISKGIMSIKTKKKENAVLFPLYVKKNAAKKWGLPGELVEKPGSPCLSFAYYALRPVTSWQVLSIITCTDVTRTYVRTYTTTTTLHAVPVTCILCTIKTWRTTRTSRWTVAAARLCNHVRVHYVLYVHGILGFIHACIACANGYGTAGP